ncbi:hypothetical protein CPLU01_04928 [Colletotrichum plurivorum]|uniref:N-acetyltransferase domain-containing protein n=1 Tax=Colletotrichum plurivorum TaxID=2175906 RepID=A0A8H6KNH8_9PEZI|nr:hypothetical protein CPLU01_04928 [Colletotrichum plurivorum]
MVIEILPATEADCPRLVQIDKTAFEAASDSAFEHVLFPPSGTDDASAAKEAIFARTMREDPSARFIKAVDTELSGDAAVVGWAKWHVWDGERGMPPAPAEREWSGAGFNAEACREYFSGVDRVKNKVMAGRRCLYLQPVATDPAHQRRGVGRQLIEWGLDEAARVGFPAYLVASPDGYPLYVKCGFVDVEEVRMDFTRFGVPRVCTSRLMVRESP